VATAERELTEPVDLCTPDGKRLNPAARGWSRTPLHTGNLRGGWGRTKRWDYWCILAADLVVAVTYADVDYLGMATVWWCDLATGRSGGAEPTLPLARGVALPDRPGAEPLRYEGQGLTLALVDDAGGTTITASWTEAGGAAAALDLRVDLPPGHESLNVVIPWSDRRFQYTSKHQARPARGTLTVGDEMLTPDSSRFWPADGYAPGRGQPSFDKQFVRDWATASGWDKSPPAPAIPDEVVARTREKYLQAYGLIAGESFSDWSERVA